MNTKAANHITEPKHCDMHFELAGSDIPIASGAAVVLMAGARVVPVVVVVLAVLRALALVVLKLAGISVTPDAAVALALSLYRL